MRFPGRGVILTAVAAVGMAAGSGPAFAAPVGPAAQPAAVPAWQEMTLPDVPGSSSLTQVAAVSTQDAWAVGWSSPQQGTLEPLILHWNGTAWSLADTAGIPAGVNLYGIVAPAAGDVWLAGQDESSNFIFRLSGSQWVSMPLPAGLRRTFLSLAAAPGGQIWAYGGFSANAFYQWTGTAWQAYQTGESSLAYIGGLSFASSTDGWAVGSFDTAAGNTPPLVLHWNGTTWSKASTPPLPSGASQGGELDSVLDTPSGGVWATGSWQGTDDHLDTANNWLVHYNGKSWSTVAVPAAFQADEYSIGNISVGASGQPQWIGVSLYNDETGYTGTSEYLYDSGGTWTISQGPTAGDLESGMNLSGVPGSNATWAVGEQMTGGTHDAPDLGMRIEYAP
jgi:hypothetical protein